MYFFFLSSSLVARAVSGVQTPAPAYKMQYPYQLS